MNMDLKIFCHGPNGTLLFHLLILVLLAVMATTSLAAVETTTTPEPIDKIKVNTKQFTIR